jgi:hypothetical protein
MRLLAVGVVATAVLVMTGNNWTQQDEKNRVTMGPGFVKGQTGERRLVFTPPPKWKTDTEASKALGLYAVLVPDGQTIDKARSAITVAFQKRDPKVPGLDTLENFFRTDLGNTLHQFPSLEGARWQPSGLDPDKVHFMSMEMFSKEKDGPSPHRVVFIDSGDGFFSVTLTTKSREELNRPEYEHFFDSLTLQ